MKIRLGDADRERFGCPETLPIDLASITNRDAVALQKIGYPTPRALMAAMENVDEVDYEAWTALVWLALRHAGIETDPATLEFSVVTLRILPDMPVEPKAPGKAPAGRATSTTSARTRSTRGATSKAKSTPTGSLS